MQQPPAAEAPLVATKLFVPRLRPNRVDRGRLRERLDQSRHSVLVSAPAGSGKSTFLADWAISSGQRVAWVSLEMGDDDPRRFLEYVVASLLRAEAIGWTQTVESVQLADPKAMQVALTEILNSMATSGQTTLILDDYHVIQSQRVHDIVQFVVDHLPLNLRVVIATRSDPPLALSRMRARDELIEVRGADLRFSLDEAARFFKESMDLHLGDSEVAELERRTEGWAVGLQMAALSLKGRSGAATFIAGFTGSNRFVLDYLTEEVLARQPEDLRNFLLETSILDRLSGPLCEAVTGRNGAEWTLQLLDASNLFLIPLDDVRYWYRYHHLFGALLQHHLKRSFDDDHIKQLHQRASDWYRQNGSPDTAITHATAAGDVERTRSIVFENVLGRLMSGDSASVLRWMTLIPEEDRENRVDLLAYQAAANILEFQVEKAQERVTRAEQLANETTPVETLVALYATRALVLRTSHRIDEAVEFYQRGLRLVAPGTLWHSILSFELAMTAMARGDLINAEKALEFSRKEHETPYVTLVLAQCTTAISRYLRGYPEEAVALAEEAFQWIERRDPENETGRPQAAFPYSVLAEVHRQWNDLEAARKYAESGLEHGRRGFRAGYFESVKARLAIAESESDWDTAARLSAEMTRNMFPTWTQTLQWIAHRVRLRRGQRTGSVADVESVARALEEARLLDPPYHVREHLLPNFYATDAFVLAARVLVLKGRLDDASLLLRELLEVSKERDCTFTVIEVLIIRSLREAASEDIDAATATMQEALELAARPRFVRLFADEGSAAVPMIERALLRTKDRDFATRVLSACAVKRAASDVLSDREIDVLRLIAEGASNQEAGRKLFISPSTVKKHLENIYGKLAVGGRVEAIARARELRLL